MEIQDVNRIKNKWFFSETGLYVVMSTHKIVESDKTNNVSCGSKNIYINFDFFKDKSIEVLEEYLVLECIRILLKHPYQRKLPNTEAAYIASNLLIANHYKFRYIDLYNTNRYFGNNKLDNECYENIYKALVDNNKSGDIKKVDPFYSDGDAIKNASEWDEDEFMLYDLVELTKNIKNNVGFGKLPGSLIEKIDSAEIIRYNYKKVFQSFKKDIISSKKVLTRMKPNRRFGFLQMGSRREYQTNLLLVCDVSMSMGKKELSKFLSFVSGFFQYGIDKIDVIQFDTRVIDTTLQSIKKKPEFIEFKGRGGTIIDDIVKYINERSKTKYGACIVFTDGEFIFNNIYWKENKKKVDYMWCFTDENKYKNAPKELKNMFKCTYIEK